MLEVRVYKRNEGSLPGLYILFSASGEVIIIEGRSKCELGPGPGIPLSNNDNCSSLAFIDITVLYEARPIWFCARRLTTRPSFRSCRSLKPLSLYGSPFRLKSSLPWAAHFDVQWNIENTSYSESSAGKLSLPRP